MGSKYDGGLVVGLFMGLLIGVAISCGVAGILGMAPLSAMRSSAVKAGAAHYEANEDGGVEFVWNKCDGK